MNNRPSSTQKRQLKNIVFIQNQGFKRYRDQPYTEQRQYVSGLSGPFYQESIPGTFYNTLDKKDLIQLIINKNQYIDRLRTFIKDECIGQIYRNSNILNNRTQSHIEIEEPIYSRFVPYQPPSTPSSEAPSSEAPSSEAPSEPSASSPSASSLIPSENTPMTPPRQVDIQVIDSNVFPDVPNKTPKEIITIIEDLHTKHSGNISINNKKSIVRKVVWLIILGNIIHDLEKSSSIIDREKSNELKSRLNSLTKTNNSKGIEQVIKNLKINMQLATPAVIKRYVYPILQSQTNVVITPVPPKN